MTSDISPPQASSGVSSTWAALAYHEIAPHEGKNLYTVCIRNFEEQVRYLTGNLPKNVGIPAVTFDDGHISQYRYAGPVLDRLNVRATFFATAGWTGRSDYMSASQLRELLALGHRIEAHGWAHKMLTLCSPSELYTELHYAKCALEDHLGTPVEAISIPHGRWNRTVLRMCAHLGYREIYISEPRLRHVDGLNARVIGRVMVTRDMSAAQVERLARTGSTSVGGRIRTGIKNGARRVLGEKRYHKFWRLLASRAIAAEHTQQVRQPLRVLQLISSQGFYGAESMLISLAKDLNNKSCHNVVGVFRNSEYPYPAVAERARQNGLQVEDIACRGQFDSMAVLQIRRLIYENGIDIIHTHGFKANFYGFMASRPLSIGRVATYHIDWPDRGWRLYCYHLLDRLILRRFNRIIAVSDAIERSLIRSLIPSRKTRVIANGIDLSPFIWCRRAREREFHGSSATTIGVVGRLTPQKGHQFLLQAAPGILAQRPDVRFVFFGDGPERENLQEAARVLGLESQVHFAGQSSDMPAVYSSLDLLVLPSINEGMPMTLIEGLASATPIIATAVGDVHKLIRNGETGLLVEPADPEALTGAVLKMLSDPIQAETMARTGQQLVQERFSAEVMAEEYSAVYRDVLGEIQRKASA